ncbi:MAG: carboxypeptidase regulatory-like domain-containing protein, partial [candidate division KSB1 bacterium]|nr:carboxypeptidase regulatory-like domain-containing protein [candidate division KSB1 bacterium]
TPLAGATVTNGNRSTVTGTNGRYTLGVLAGTHTLSASKQGYLSSENKVVTLTPGQTLSGINFVLSPNASVITGRVTSGSLPVYKATITAQEKNLGTRKTAETDANGYFSLSVTSGTYILKATKTGFVSSPDSILVTIAPGQTIPNQNFNLRENLSYISGMVKSESTPVRNATIQVAAIDAPDQAATFSTETGVDGSFNLSVLPDLKYAVQVTRSGYYSQSDTTTKLILGQTVTLVFNLSLHQSRIKGKILASNGASIGEALIQAANASLTFTSRSEASGYYTLGVNAGTYPLSVQKSGFIPGSKQITIGVGDTLSGVDFTLTPNVASLDGRITNSSTGAGIENALVVVTETSSGQGGSIHSNAQGNYLIQNLSPGIYKITVTHPSYQEKSLNNQVFAGGSANRVNFTLTPKNGRIEGRVTSNGVGMSGVTITASVAGVSTSAVTATDGTYSISNLTPGSYSVQASLTGYTSSSPKTVEVPVNGLAQADFIVTPNEGRITGFVKQNGTGMGGAQVTAIGLKGNSGFTTSASDGSFTIPDLALDTYKVSVNLQGYSSTPEDTTVTLRAGVTISLNFALTRSVVQIAGEVRDQAGNPLANIRVVEESSKGRGETTTDGNGRFQFINLPTNTQYVVRTDIFQEGYDNDDSVIVAGKNDISGIVLRVGVHRSKIRGNVGVPAATVTAENLQRKLSYSTLSQPDGSFLLKDLYDGTYKISVFKLGYRADPSQQSVPNLAIGEERGGINFTLTPVRIAISGTVKDTQGNSLPNVPILAWSVDATQKDTTESNGSYTIANLPPNLTYTLETRLSPLDYENNSVMIRSGEADTTAPALTIAVHNSSIQGRVTEGSGEPIPGAVVTLSGVDSVVSTDSQGYYGFYHLYSGNYTLTISKEGFEKVAPFSLDLSQGETRTQNFSLIPLTSAIYGVVSDAEGRLRNVLIKVTDEKTGQTVSRDTTDAGGIYGINRLTVGNTYTVEASKKGYEKQVQSGINLTGGSVTVDFKLEPIPNSIYGEVTRKIDGKEVPGALVKVTGLSGGTWSDSTDALGLFSVPGLLSRTYSIVAESDGLISPSQTINLAAGASVKVNLSLETTGAIEGVVKYRGKGRAGATITAANGLAGTVASTVSDTSGYYKIKGLLNGEYVVSCAIPGFTAEPSPQVITLTSEATKTAHFNLRAETNSILGRVTDWQSVGLSGVKVWVWNDQTRDSTLTDLNGQFQITNLVDGSYQVRASLPGYYPSSVSTVSLIGGEPIIVDIQLTPIQNSISGFVKDGTTANPIFGVRVIAKDSLGNTFADTTENDGSYFFELAKGSYRLKAEKAGYQASRELHVFLPKGKSVTQDLILVPIFTTSTIAGTIHRGKDFVEAAKVVCSSLTNVSLRDTVYSDHSGAYQFTNLPAPGDYLLEVTKPDFPTLSSPVFQLTQTGIRYDFWFPSAQLKWKITREGTTPLPGVTIRVSSGTEYTELQTNSLGESQTKDNLKEGNYNITIEADRQTIPVMGYNLQLPKDSVHVEEIYLPFIHLPVNSVSIMDSIKIDVLALSAPQDSLWLYYKGVSASGFSRTRMVLTHRTVGDTMLFSAVFPPQGTTGEVTYYLTTKFQGRSYSNEGKPFKVNVTREGILSRLALSPEKKRVPTRVPVLLQVRAYDGVNKPLVPEKVTWQISQGKGRFTNFSQDSSRVWFQSDIDTTTVIRVTISREGMVMEATAEIITETRVLGSLSVNSSALEISSRDSLRFTYSAADTGGVRMAIYPIWYCEPRTSGVLIPGEDGESALFKPDTSFLGQVRIFLKDSLSGTTVSFNSGQDISLGDAGLKVYQVITEKTPQIEVTDGEGFSLIIPAGAVDPGVSLKVKLNKPQIPNVKRLTAQYEVSGNIYNLTVTGRIKEGKELTLKLPIAETAKNKNLSVGYWDVNSLDWIIIPSTREEAHLVAQTSHFSQFAVLQASEPLGIKEVQLLPNPFTPYDSYGLQIGFTLTSNDTRNPWVTVKIYNLLGELVKTLCENQPMAKGIYTPGDVNTLKWDGRTDHGDLARNGRYLVVMEARDNTGEKREMKTVVLIK